MLFYPFISYFNISTFTSIHSSAYFVWIYEKLILLSNRVIFFESKCILMILKGSVGKRVVLRNECAVADEPARLGPQVNVGSLLSVELVVKPTRSSSRGVGWSMTHHGGVGLRLLRLLPSCKNGFRRVIPDFGPFDEQISSFFFFFSFWRSG